MIPTAGKQIALDQLQAEMLSSNLNVSSGLGQFGDFVFPYDANGNPAEFNDMSTAQTILANHVATRPLTDEELNVLYAQANNNNDSKTMHRIVAMAQGLIARDRVPL